MACSLCRASWWTVKTYRAPAFLSYPASIPFLIANLKKPLCGFFFNLFDGRLGIHTLIIGLVGGCWSLFLLNQFPFGFGRVQNVVPTMTFQCFLCRTLSLSLIHLILWSDLFWGVIEDQPLDEDLWILYILISELLLEKVSENLLLLTGLDIWLWSYSWIISSAINTNQIYLLAEAESLRGGKKICSSRVETSGRRLHACFTRFLSNQLKNKSLILALTPEHDGCACRCCSSSM